nr:MAG TPA: hypothetical protein [Caudoviricetes sp.]
MGGIRKIKKARPKPGYASHLARIYDSRNSFFGERLNPQADA